MPRDAVYILDLCDKVLALTARREHRFDFLRGDQRKNGRPGVCLPVDAYYEELRLVVEYHERQHTEAVPIFDRRPTVSGVSRGEQRRRYDDRRRAVLPKNGLQLLALCYSDFDHDTQKRLRRVAADEATVRAKLTPWLAS